MDASASKYDFRGHTSSCCFNHDFAIQEKRTAELISEASSETAAPNIPHAGMRINNPVISIAELNKEIKNQAG